MSRHSKKERIAYKKRRRKVALKIKIVESWDRRLFTKVNAVKKVEDWLRKNELESERDKSVLDKSETFSEKVDMCQDEKFKKDKLYVNFQRYCFYSALKEKVDKFFNGMQS